MSLPKNEQTHPLPKDYWRSLDELADTQSFREFLHREFPKGTMEMVAESSQAAAADASSSPAHDQVTAFSRRDFLTIMGASFALAGLTSCRRPVETIVPHVNLPESYDPGVPEYYATSMPYRGGAIPLLVKSTDGRPTKIEGNPEHPSSRGKSNLFAQASILNLYDPDRSKVTRQGDQESTLSAFQTAWIAEGLKLDATKGAGLAILAEPTGSPSMLRARDAILQRFPMAKWVSFAPISNANARAGFKLATGKELFAHYTLSQAKVILSVGADFLMHETDDIRLAQEFVAGRKVMLQSDDMNRLYAVESAYTVTGAQADHRLRLKPSEFRGFLVALAQQLAARGVQVDGIAGLAATNIDSFGGKFLTALADELVARRSSSAILAGWTLGVAEHALVMSINTALGNVGSTVTYQDASSKTESELAALTQLASDMQAGQITHLFCLGTNPVYHAPANLDFATKLAKVPFSVTVAELVDETSQRSSWHIPKSHYLESWGDVRGFDGTLSIVQPLIAPLYASLSPLEVAMQIAGVAGTAVDYVKQSWQAVLPTIGFDSGWRKVLHDGLLVGTASPVVQYTLDAASIATSLATPALQGSGLELCFVESKTGDGEFANNGWLQELSDPITKVTWDNPATLSYRTAKELGIHSGDLMILEVAGQRLEIAAWVSPGQSDGVIVLPLGNGRTIGKVATGHGFNTYAVRTSDSFTGVITASVSKGSGTHKIAQTQEHGTMGGFKLGDENQDEDKRPIVRETTLAAYKKEARFFPEPIPTPPLKSLWTDHAYDTGYQWGMVIDLNSCFGCSACSVACQSENNIPVVGKEQVDKGREMHWIRVDRYYSGDLDTPEMSVTPVPCMHCETAPCESVCPVNATVHDPEGLNGMAYNRCIGTRYCSNNCPYKVRRFNFFNYTSELPETLKMVQNPDVTVRFRGVMEKCTYCTQRISLARIAAKKDGVRISDDRLQTACQQACPAGAITFGDILNPASKVSELRNVNRNYAMLGELHTKPRTTYLARLRNPNPALEVA